MKRFEGYLKGVNLGGWISQFAKYDVESVGLLKFDFLGLRTLTVMRDTADMVYENYGVKIDFDSIPLDDANIYKMIGAGDTVGVFQLESRGMTSFLKDLKPSSLEDIIAGISLYRPGPLDMINIQDIDYDNNCFYDLIDYLQSLDYHLIPLHRVQ